MMVGFIGYRIEMINKHTEAIARIQKEHDTSVAITSSAKRFQKRCTKLLSIATEMLAENEKLRESIKELAHKWRNPILRADPHPIRQECAEHLDELLEEKGDE